MNRVLVIGATGNVGRPVVSALVTAGTSVRAMTRSPQAAAFGPAVEIVRGDLMNPESLDPGLEGIDRVFLIWTAPIAAAAAALARIAGRARRIVFLSAPLKTPHPFFQQPNPRREEALEIERLIEGSGLEWTFLRPAMFAGNTIGWWARQIRAGDTVRWPYLDCPTAPVDERDIAATAVRALCDEGHAGKEYVLTGPESLTQLEQISTIGRAIGRELRAEEISPDEARRELLAIMPLPVVDMLLDAYAAGRGQAAFVTTTVADITGTPARSFAEWAIDHAGRFR